MTTRRSFLGAMLAACAAPAVVKSDSLMKLWVPPKRAIQVMRVGVYDAAQIAMPAEWVDAHARDLERSILFGANHGLLVGDVIRTSAGLMAVVDSIRNNLEVTLAPETGRYVDFEKELAQASRKLSLR
jgi:hypothetical protein